MLRLFLGVGIGFATAQWILPALTGKPPRTSRMAPEDQELSIHRITGDMVYAFDEIKPFLWQIHTDTADNDLSVQDMMRAVQQLRRSGVI